MSGELPLLSLRGLEAWLETQSPSRTYVFADNQDCLLFRYFTDMGVPVHSVDSGGWNDTECRYHVFPGTVAGVFPICSGFNSPLNQVAYEGEETYGAALERVKSLISEGYN